MFLDNISVNFVGVLIAAIVYFVIGAIWYSRFLFADEFGRHHEPPIGETKEEISSNKVGSYIGEFIISLIIAYVLSIILEISQAVTIIEGITVALWIWIGFIATTHFSAVLWARKTVRHFFIHAGFMLVGLLAMGAILMYFI